MRAVRALMVDVDGVLVEGQPGDGLHWAASMEEDLGFTSEMLHERLFAPHWEDIVAGRAGLMERVGGALAEFAPQVSAEALVDYWFARDARLAAGLLEELGRRRAEGMLVYLATNQEHLRAAYLMGPLGLAAAVDGIFYSAALGVRKPEGEFFHKVQVAVGLQAEELLLVDYSLVNVEAALRAGWQALHWTGVSSPEMLRARCR